LSVSSICVFSVVIPIGLWWARRLRYLAYELSMDDSCWNVTKFVFHLFPLTGVPISLIYEKFKWLFFSLSSFYSLLKRQIATALTQEQYSMYQNEVIIELFCNNLLIFFGLLIMTIFNLHDSCC